MLSSYLPEKTYVVCSNQTVEFRAMTIKSGIIAMIIGLVIAISITEPIYHFYNFHSIKRPSISAMTLVYGTIFIISISILWITSHFIISSKYKISLNDKYFNIYKANNLKYSIPVKEISYIELATSNNPQTSGFVIKYLGKKITIYNGLIFTFNSEKKLLGNLIISNINPFFESLDIFKLSKKIENETDKIYIYKKTN